MYGNLHVLPLTAYCSALIKSRKIFGGNTFTVSENPQISQKFSVPLQCLIMCSITYIITYVYI